MRVLSGTEHNQRGFAQLKPLQTTAKTLKDPELPST
jgi:hypothetical protein